MADEDAFTLARGLEEFRKLATTGRPPEEVADLEHAWWTGAWWLANMLRATARTAPEVAAQLFREVDAWEARFGTGDKPQEPQDKPVVRLRGHLCHWPGCTTEVPPKMWGCPKHWAVLPMHLRAKIWKHYRPGQEVDKRPSPEYAAAAQDVQDWIKYQAGANKPLPPSGSEA